MESSVLFLQKMYSYITSELPATLEATFPGKLNGKKSIFGHSMGGHGALTLALKNPTAFTSVSAFSPICHPTNCPWGTKAFSGYLGSVQAGEAHDASLLVGSYNGPPVSLLVDQGTADPFLIGETNQLQPEALRAACDASSGKVKLDLRMRDGYDHSYYFISTFIEEHINYHADALASSG